MLSKYDLWCRSTELICLGSCTSCHTPPGVSAQGPWPCGPNATNSSRRSTTNGRRQGRLHLPNRSWIWISPYKVPYLRSFGPNGSFDKLHTFSMIMLAQNSCINYLSVLHWLDFFPALTTNCATTSSTVWCACPAAGSSTVSLGLKPLWVALGGLTSLGILSHLYFNNAGLRGSLYAFGGTFPIWCKLHPQILVWIENAVKDLQHMLLLRSYFSLFSGLYIFQVCVCPHDCLMCVQVELGFLAEEWILWKQLFVLWLGIHELTFHSATLIDWKCTSPFWSLQSALLPFATLWQCQSTITTYVL